MAHILLRYGEIHLKGQNQRFFLDALVRNVRESIADLGRAQVRHAFGRILVDSPAEEEALVGRLRKVFGVVSLSPVQVASPALPDIAGAAVDIVGAALGTRPGIATFKVDTRRADKRFPLTSMETSREVGQTVQHRFPQLQARMDGPDLLVRIDIRDQAYLSSETIPGPGVLPYGTGGRALALIFWGIDSPAASWLRAQLRVTNITLHLHSLPFTNEQSEEDVLEP